MSKLFAGPMEKEGCCSEPPGNSGVESGGWALVPESVSGNQTMLTVSIILDLYQGFILLADCSSKGGAALWCAKYQAQLLHILIETIVRQLEDTRLLCLTWSKGRDTF